MVWFFILSDFVIMDYYVYCLVFVFLFLLVVLGVRLIIVGVGKV